MSKSAIPDKIKNLLEAVDFGRFLCYGYPKKLVRPYNPHLLFV